MLAVKIAEREVDEGSVFFFFLKKRSGNARLYQILATFLILWVGAGQKATRGEWISSLGAAFPAPSWGCGAGTRREESPLRLPGVLPLDPPWAGQLLAVGPGGLQKRAACWPAEVQVPSPAHFHLYFFFFFWFGGEQGVPFFKSVILIKTHDSHSNLPEGTPPRPQVSVKMNLDVDTLRKDRNSWYLFIYFFNLLPLFKE